MRRDGDTASRPRDIFRTKKKRKKSGTLSLKSSAVKRSRNVKKKKNRVIIPVRQNCVINES